MIDMLNKDGLFKLKPQILDYFTDITPNWTFSKGDFDGITPQPMASYPDIDLFMWAVYTPSGRNAWVKNPIPGVQELMEKHRRELDDDKRFDILYQIQQKMAVEMPVIPRPAWPKASTSHGHGWATTRPSSTGTPTAARPRPGRDTGTTRARKQPDTG